jgi:hypothetical protein
MLWLLLGASSRELAALYNSGFELSSLSPLSALGLVLLGGGTGWVSALISSYRNIAAIDP